MKIMASGPRISWQVNEESMEMVRDFFSWLQNHCRWWLQHKIKIHLLLGSKAMTKQDRIFKNRDTTLPTKV